MNHVSQLALTALITLLLAIGNTALAATENDTDEGAAGIEAEPGTQAGEEADTDAEERDHEGEPIDQREEAQPGTQGGEEAEEGAEENEGHN